MKDNTCVEKTDIVYVDLMECLHMKDESLKNNKFLTTILNYEKETIPYFIFLTCEKNGFKFDGYFWISLLLNFLEGNYLHIYLPGEASDISDKLKSVVKTLSKGGIHGK